jgi:hypothetical protein
LLTDPLGLPIEPLWEYVILWVIGEIVHAIAWRTSPGGTFGSLIYWGTKLIAFVAIWLVLYVLIAVIKFIIAYWVWFAVGAGALVAIGIAYLVWSCKYRPSHT